MAMNFCSNCGAKLRAGAKFCGSCGQKISDASSPKVELQKSASPTSTQPTYTPPEDTTPHYKEDETFQEMFLTSNGRLNRMRYFKRTLAVDLIYFLAALIITLACSTPWGDLTQTGDALITIAAVITLIPKFHLDVRRLKDSAMFDSEDTIKLFAGVVAVISLACMFMSAGWDFSSPMPPIVKDLSLLGSIAWIPIQFPAGTVGANKYGADPLENERVGR